jgi:methyl-accepting chemotaxis protein
VEHGTVPDDGDTEVHQGAAMSDAPGDNAAILERVIAELDHLNRHTEQEFLHVGGKLMAFIEAVNQISSELTVVANLMSGEHAQHTFQALTWALNRSTQMKARAEADNELLVNVPQQARRFKRTLAGFDGTVSTFRTLGVLTQIETARLGSLGADFGDLAVDVKSAARSIQSKVEAALDTGAHLIPSLEGALRSVSALQARHGQDLPRLIAGALASLSSFREMQSRTSAASIRLGAEYGAISESFKALVVSLQFHDITRQQVEHVIEALRRLCADADGGALVNEPRTAAVIAIQSMQLADADRKFAALVASVSTNLDQIGAHVLTMADESRTVSGLSPGETTSFFREMEEGCGAIFASLSQGETAQAAINISTGQLVDTIHRMRGPIDEIRTIEHQMHRMALNARISAAQIGVAGDALGVLAGAVQQLSSECRERSDVLIAALGAMGHAAAGLSGHGGRPSAGELEDQGVGLVQMRTAVAELHSSSECSAAQIALIAARCGTLRDDLTATRQSLSVGALFAAVVGRSRERLEEMAGDHPVGMPHDEARGADSGLADITRHYTMQAEHDVHASVIGAVAGAAPEPATDLVPPPSRDAGEFGDNVELF